MPYSVGPHGLPAGSAKGQDTQSGQPVRVLLPLFEKILFDSTVFVEAFFVRSVKMPLFTGLDNIELLFQEGADFAMLDDASLSLLSLMDLGRFLGSPGFWLGIVVCGLFTTAAIYVRRYRDDS